MAVPGPLLTIGYGNRSIAELLDLLDEHGVVNLVDIRSVPRSRAHPDFDQPALRRHVEASGRRYTWLGWELGGNSEGRTPAEFRNGLRRLAAMSADGRLAVLCAELRPEGCHRTRLVGAALAAAGLPPQHIDERGRLVAHADVVRRLTGGQVTLDARPAVPAPA